MNIRRQKGIEKEISRVLGLAILTEVKNEKIRNLVTIHNVSLTPDGKYLKLVFNVLNYNENINKEKILDELNALKGYFRKVIASKLNLRYTPEINISIDDSIEYSAKMFKILDNLKNTEE